MEDDLNNLAAERNGLYLSFALIIAQSFVWRRIETVAEAVAAALVCGVAPFTMAVLGIHRLKKLPEPPRPLLISWILVLIESSLWLAGNVFLFCWARHMLQSIHRYLD